MADCRATASSTDEADEGVAAGENADDVGAAADLPVEPFFLRLLQICRQIAFRKAVKARSWRGQRWLEEQLAQTSPDLLRAMVTTFAEALMGAEADAVCGAPSLRVTSAEDGAGWLA